MALLEHASSSSYISWLRTVQPLLKPINVSDDLVTMSPAVSVPTFIENKRDNKKEKHEKYSKTELFNYHLNNAKTDPASIRVKGNNKPKFKTMHNVIFLMIHIFLSLKWKKKWKKIL